MFRSTRSSPSTRSPTVARCCRRTGAALPICPTPSSTTRLNHHRSRNEQRKRSNPYRNPVIGQFHSRKEEHMKKLLWPLIAAFAFIASPGYAQDKSADMNMQILRDKLKADKKVLVAA